MSDPDRNDRDERNDERSGGIFGIRIGAGLGALADLLDELDENDRIERSGHTERGGRSVDYRYSVESGLGDLSSSDASPARRRRPRKRRGDNDDRRSGEGPDRSRKKRAFPEDEYLTTVRETDDGVVVYADLAGVDADELSLGFDDERSDLVIGVEDEPVERVSLEWDDVNATDVSFNNQVLEIHLVPGDEESDKEDGQ